MLRVALAVNKLAACRQWRRSVLKSEESGSVRSSHQTRSLAKFVFGAENGYQVIFGFFRFRPKMSFRYRFIFRFCSKNVISVGPKMLCSQLNCRLTKLCDIGTAQVTFVFVFGRIWYLLFHFIGIFVYGRKQEAPMTLSDSAYTVTVYLQVEYHKNGAS